MHVKLAEHLTVTAVPCLAKYWRGEFAFPAGAGWNGRMQGSSRPDRTLLDARALCRHLLGEGSVHAFMAEHRSALFPDELFADLFPTKRGRPSVPSDVIATGDQAPCGIRS